MGSNPSLAIIDLRTSVYNDYVHCVYYVHVCTSMCTCVCMCVHGVYMVCSVHGVYLHLCASVCMCVYVCVHCVYLSLCIST